MTLSIFDFNDYKLYLNVKINSLSVNGRGVKKRIAEHLSCQSTYISQVFKGKKHFTLEQAIKLNTFLDHSEVEGKLFLLLVQQARSGSNELREFFVEQISDFKQKHKDSSSESNLLVGQQNYDLCFESWYHSVIYAILNFDDCKTVNGISKRLGFDEKIVSIILNEFIEAKLVSIVDGQYEKMTEKVNVGEKNIQKFHNFWRGYALKNPEEGFENDYKRTLVLTLSDEDDVKVREVIKDTFKKIHNIANNSSKNETAKCLILDYLEF